MKTCWLMPCVALFVALNAGPAMSQAAKAGDAEKDFTPMFNGKDFTGWRFSDGSEAPANWKVQDGVIQVTGGGKPHLITAAEYGDYEMAFEWRSLKDKYNSGYFIRTGPGGGKNQINLAKGSEGAFIGGKLEGATKVPELQNPPGEWNQWRVRVAGDKVTFWCNGKPAWEGVGLTPAQGHIGLQAEGAALEFRNLRIKAN